MTTYCKIGPIQLPNHYISDNADSSVVMVLKCLVWLYSCSGLNNYQLVIPTGSVKDKAGNNNSKYVLNFKTSKY